MVGKNSTYSIVYFTNFSTIENCGSEHCQDERGAVVDPSPASLCCCCCAAAGELRDVGENGGDLDHGQDDVAADVGVVVVDFLADGREGLETLLL